MNRLDLIIDALERANELWLTEPIGEKALAAARELKVEKQEPVKCTCGYAIGHPLVTSCSCKREQALNKKADNARDLGLDYEPEQKPVAWMVRDQVDGCRYPSALKNPAGSINGESQPLYTAPPRKEWVGLTSEELAQLTIDNIGYPTRLTAAIEAKLKEKNSV